MRVNLAKLVKLLVPALVVLVLLWTNVPRARAGDEKAQLLTMDEFRGQITQAVQEGNRPRLEDLASKHRHLLRGLFNDTLNQLLALKDEAPKSQTLALASALAELAKKLSLDEFPSRQLQGYQAWSPDQLAVKAQAELSAAKARTAFREGRYGEVAAPAQAALKLYASLGDEAGEGEMLHYLGQAQRRLANYGEAIRHHERALNLARKSRDRLGQGRALTDLADVYERQKDLPRALKLYQQALALFKIPEDWQEAGTALRQLGDVYVALGDFEKAYRAYNQALTYAQEVQDPIRQSEFQAYLGYFYRRLGDFTKAMEHLNRSLENAGQIGDGELQAQARARAFNHLGLCQERLAELALADHDRVKAQELYRQALAYEEQALTWAEKANDCWRQGYVLRALSLIHRELGKLSQGDEALKEYQRALTRADQALESALCMREKEWEGLALHHKAMAQGLLGQDADGLATFDRALEIWARIGDLYSMGQAYRFIGQNFHASRGRNHEAILAYNRALATFAKLGDVESQAYTLFDQAKIYGKEGRKAETAQLYEEALTKLERVRTRSGLLEFKKAFMERVYNLYVEAALYMLQNQYNERAFRYAESMKARVFLDQLAEGLVNLERGIEPGLKKQRDDLENQHRVTGEQLAEQYKRQPPDEAGIATLKAKLDRLSSELERLEKQIRLKNPLYASVQYPKPITLTNLQKILKQDEIMLEYFLSPGGVYCFVITKNNYTVVKLSVTEEELRKSVGALLENINGLIRGETFDQTTAGNLYDILIKPFEAHIKGKTLIIVPDGILARLPFELLVIKDKEGEVYLLERTRIKYVQSASVLGLLRTHYKKLGRSDKFIGFGDPVYDYENFKAGRPEREDGLKRGAEGTVDTQLTSMRYARTGVKLCRLLGSGQEVEAIARLFNDHHKKARGLVRLDAREEYAKGKEMGRYGYIHFSTHGILDPKFQAIALSQIPDSREDGLLTLGEIMNLKYNAHLVVLSACQTGCGPTERGEGVTGLTRAVMYAGSPAAVVSLWSVSDEGTKELMVKFYENLLKKGLTREAALRAAKLDMLSGQYKHPFFWAAFVMYGE
jgi:CHAT domain-containing protein